MFAKEKIKGEGRPRKPRRVRGLAVLVVAVLVSLVVAVIPASAEGSIIDCTQLTSIKVASSSYPFAAVRYGQSDTELGYAFGVNSVWYRPVDSSGESPAPITDYEMHFDIGTQINTGDTYTLTYDIYFPTNFNSNSQLVMPGFDFNYVASVNGRWETLTSNAVRYWHWQGSATVTAGFSTSDITIIPRGLEVGNWVVVRSLKVSIAGKDYTGAINSTKDEIKANNDKNTDRIINNQNELQEKEKTEANNSGSSAVDKASSAVPGVDGGFLNSIKSFVSVLSYNDTKAELKIPRVYIPSIGGYFDEITLIEPQTFDLSKQIDDFIPETILTLIRYLCTIALIIYCFKEWYNVWNYIFTLKESSI